MSEGEGVEISGLELDADTLEFKRSMSHDDWCKLVIVYYLSNEALGADDDC